MIEPCSEDGTKDKCEQCQGGAINNHVTSSINDSWMKYRCFNVTKEQLCSPGTCVASQGPCINQSIEKSGVAFVKGDIERNEFFEKINIQ